MKKFVDFFKGRTLPFYLGLGSLVLGLINTILYAIYSSAVGHFNALILVLLILSTLSCVSIILTKFKYAPLVSCLLFSASFGFYIDDRLIMFEEMINKIYGMTESGAILPLVLLIFVLMLICVIAMVVSCFLDEKQKEALK